MPRRRRLIQRLMRPFLVIVMPERIEPRLFKSLNKPHEVLQIEVGVGVSPRIAPPRGMDADRTHDGAEMKLLCHVERSLHKHPGRCRPETLYLSR